MLIFFRCTPNAWSSSSFIQRRRMKDEMPTHLDQILAHTLLQVNARKAAADYAALERKAADAHAPRIHGAACVTVGQPGPGDHLRDQEGLAFQRADPR